MTIAACYVSSEGVVLGTDSTTSNVIPHPAAPAAGETHHFNFGQKIFEVGSNSSVGIATWGLGSLGSVSYRTLIASLGDRLEGAAPKSMSEVAGLWATLFWGEYQQAFTAELNRARQLAAIAARSKAEDEELDDLILDLSVGFCLGGHTEERRPEAYEVSFRPDHAAPQAPQPIPLGRPRFWGWSNLMNRLNYGMDDALFNAIIASGHWNADPNELIQIVLNNRIAPTLDLPLRDAIDWVYSSIYTTIKALKYSHFRPYCGGPIELAVITTDRNFRWVCHKTLDAAID